LTGGLMMLEEVLLKLTGKDKKKQKKSAAE
jgi:hypothetical protein